MGKLEGEKELPAMDSINALLNLQQFPSMQEIQANAQNEILVSSGFDSAAAHDDFLEKMLLSVPASEFPWPEDQQALGSLEEQSPAIVASKMRQQQISSIEANAMILQQQLLLSRELAAGNGQMSHVDQNDVVDGVSFSFPNMVYGQPNGIEASAEASFNDFQGYIAQNSIQSQSFNHPQAIAQRQPQNCRSPVATSIGSSSSGAVAQPRQRVRARRGQATDPHSIAERLRRERIAERMKALQELVPNANKIDKASMLDEIIDYVKFLQLQVKVLSMSRLGCGAATVSSTGVSPLAAAACDKSLEGNGGETTALSTQDNDGMTVTEQQVAKLMEEDMGAAMQYLQGKGLCLMPISLATGISHRNPIIGKGEPGCSSPERGAV